MTKAASLDSRFSSFRNPLVLGLLALVLVACVLFGGGARPGYRSDAVLQLLSVPLLLVALSQLWNDRRHSVWPLAFCGALVLVPLLQLVPLPPQVWTALPLRDLAVQSLSLAGQDVGWRPLSLTPHATWQSLASLIPPIAVFLAVLCLSWGDRRRVVLGLLGLGLLAGFVGMMQVALGAGGPPIGFGLGTPGEATGFFANRNHFAALLYCLLLLAAAFAINSAKALPVGSVKSWDSRALVAVVISFAVIVALLAAQMMARSRAGIGLTIVALLGIAALATSDERQTSGLGVKRLVGGALALVLLFASQFALYRVLERFEPDPLGHDTRLIFARTTWEAAWTLMPFGSGLGSFVPVYQFFEKPQNALSDVYANRAHNDILEMWLETGVVGLVMMALFAAWLIFSFWKVWRPWVAQATEREISPLDLLLMRAASLVIVLLVAHSLVDYPLRTTALSVLFALSCGLLYSPRTPDSGASRRSHEARDDREVSSSRDTPRRADRPIPEPVLKSETRPRRASVDPKPEWAWPTSPTEPSARDNPQVDATTQPRSPEDIASNTTSVPGQRWGAGVEWPAAWRADNKVQKPDSSE